MGSENSHGFVLFILLDANAAFPSMLHTIPFRALAAQIKTPTLHFLLGTGIIKRLTKLDKLKHTHTHRCRTLVVSLNMGSIQYHFYVYCDRDKLNL